MRFSAYMLIFALPMLSACDNLAVIPAGALAHTTAAASASPATEAAPSPTQAPTPETTQEPTPEPTAAPTPEPTPEPKPETVSLLFAGDVMFHQQTVKMQWDEAKGKYDFTSLFEGIAPIVRDADFAVASLDAPVWDLKKSKLDTDRFAAPAEALDALAAAGFDVLDTATYHSADQGTGAVTNTVEAVRAAGMKPVGTWKDEADKNSICWLEKGGIKVALYAATRKVNYSLGTAPDAGVNMIDIAAFKDEVDSARAEGADAVIFYLHFGTEYSHTTDAYQQQVVEALQAAGADAVIGANPRVVQAVEGSPEEGFFAAYSLGALDTALPSRDRQFGMMLKFSITKDPLTGKVTVGGLSWIPTWSRAVAPQGQAAKIRVYDMRQALNDARAGTDTLLAPTYLKELENGMKMISDILNGVQMEPLK